MNNILVLIDTSHMNHIICVTIISADDVTEKLNVMNWYRDPTICKLPSSNLMYSEEL